MKLELWRNYGTAYIKKMEVEVLPVVDLSEESAFSFFLFVGDATQVDHSACLLTTEAPGHHSTQTRIQASPDVA